METILPTTLSDFAKISGVGEVKKEKYADRFLAVIKQHIERLAPKEATHVQSYALFKKGLSISEIATQRNLKEDTIYGHLVKMHQEGTKIDLHKFISEQELKDMEIAIKILEAEITIQTYQIGSVVI